MSTYRYLSVEDVVRVHDDLLARYGGLPGVLKPHQLESAVAEPRQTWDGVDLYPDVWAKAAVLLRGLACNHAFVDGNKRTAAGCALLFLRANGQVLRPRHKDLEALVVAAATGERRSLRTLQEGLQRLASR